MKKKILALMIATSATLLLSCTNDSGDSSDSSQNQKGQLKTTKTERTITSLGKVKEEEIERYFYDNGRLVSKKYENTVASVAPNDSQNEDYYYDESGKLVKIIVSSKSIYGNSFKQEYIYEYSYNEKGQISEESKNTVASNSSSKNSITNCYYDIIGRLIKRTNPDFIFGPQNFSYYDTSFNLNGKYWVTEFDNKVNMRRFLSPTKAYADAQPYSANNPHIVKYGEWLIDYDIQNRVKKETSKDDYNYTYETIYEYVD